VIEDHREGPTVRPPGAEPGRRLRHGGGLSRPAGRACDLGNDPRAVVAWGRGRRSGQSNAKMATGSPACGPSIRAAVTRPGLGAPVRFIVPMARPGSTFDGAQRQRTMLVRAEDVDWTDIWNTVGLRGTASDQLHSTTTSSDRTIRSPANSTASAAKAVRSTG